MAFVCVAESVAATLGPMQAERIMWQAVVVGAGPAGASAAAWLAASGLRTLLVDRDAMPRGKVCGCCLSIEAVAELRDLARTPAAVAIDRLPVAPLDTVRLVNRGHEATLGLPGGGVVSRESLDAALVRGAIASGAAWLPRCQVTVIDESPDTTATVGLSLVTRGETVESRQMTLRAEYVVVATGLSDQVRIDSLGPSARSGRTVAAGSRIGVGVVLAKDAIDMPAGQLVMAIGREGYCGIVRLEDGRIDVAAAIDRAAVAGHGDPAEAIIDLVRKHAGRRIEPEAFATAVQGGVVRATPPLTRSASLIAGGSGRILRAGDAAAYVEPFTGEGIGWALAGGRLLAEAIMHGRSPSTGDCSDPLRVARRYAAAHHRHCKPRHRRCRRVAGFVRRPLGVAAAVAVARWMPSVAGRVVPVVVGAGGASP
ncbi:MAG: NAD(P)/FAD-dependent oxidoreductase [Planctomycetia bacterium]